MQLFPFLWPAKSSRLRAHVVVSFILLLSVRVLNIYVPIYQKIVVDDLAVCGTSPARTCFGGVA